MITTVPPKWGTVVFYACGADRAGTAVVTTIRMGAALMAAPLLIVICLIRQIESSFSTATSCLSMGLSFLIALVKGT